MIADMTDQVTIRRTIPEANKPRVLELVEHLNKRAAKLDLPALTLTTHGHEDRVIDKAGGRMMRFYDMEVVGEAPVLTGWQVLAILERVDDSQPPRDGGDEE